MNKQLNIAKNLVFIGVLASLLGASFRPYSIAVAEDNLLPRGGQNSLPIVFEARKARKTIKVVATAYNSEVGQTDSTPFITANGSHVRPGTLATNFLPFGTYVKFPDIYGDRVFVVEDRMNARYGQGRVDLWFEDHGEAVDFGVRRLTMEVL